MSDESKKTSEKTRVWKVSLSYVTKAREDATQHTWRSNEEVAVLATNIEEAITKGRKDAEDRGHMNIDVWAVNHLGGRRLVE